MLRHFLALGVILIAVSSCAPTKVVAPLEAGQWQVGATLGRPQINDGSLPIIGAYAAKGVKEGMTVYGGTQLSSLLLGTVHLEAGAVRQWKIGQGLAPSFSYSYGGQWLTSTRDGATRIYPEAGVNMYWQHLGHIGYVGANTWVDPTFVLSRYGKGSPLAPSLGAGYRYRHKYFEAQAEYKLLNPIRELVVPQATVPGTLGLGGRGLYFGLAVNF